nr:hypothetical protein [Tanacetum cinerariifolium]
MFPNVTGIKVEVWSFGNIRPFVQTPGSGISILLAVETPSTGSGKLYCQWELSPGSGNALCILFPTLPSDIYALERECKLYDAFDKFMYQKGETLRDFYLRISLLLNDMNMYNIKLEQFQVNTKFLNTLPPEWSKFVTDVKLVRDLHTTNVDQLHAYLG